MPFARPTLTQLRTTVRSNITSRVGALLRFSNLGVVGDVLAGLANGFYGYLDWIALQATPFTATGVFLEAWAALKGVVRKQPTVATCTIAAFPGAAGKTIPAGTPVVRQVDSFAYVTVADAPVVGGMATPALQATMAGAAGNASAGTALVLGSSVSGVQSSGTAQAAITGGADLEQNPALRTRMLQAFAAPAQGGAFTDYIEWAEAVAGVTRAWVKPGGMGTGSVVVYVMTDTIEDNVVTAGFPQGISGVAAAERRIAPLATGDLLRVANAIFLVQPVTPLVYAVAPLDNVVNFTIAGLSTAAAATQAAVAAAIAQVFLDEGSPGGVLLEDLTTGGTVDVSDIETAIGAVPGARGFVITGIDPENGTAVPGAAGNIISAGGYLPTLGVITWA